MVVLQNKNKTISKDADIILVMVVSSKIQGIHFPYYDCRIGRKWPSQNNLGAKTGSWLCSNKCRMNLGQFQFRRSSSTFFIDDARIDCVSYAKDDSSTMKNTIFLETQIPAEIVQVTILEIIRSICSWQCLLTDIEIRVFKSDMSIF